jgi:hypothetical protein
MCDTLPRKQGRHALQASHSNNLHSLFAHPPLQQVAGPEQVACRGSQPVQQKRGAAATMTLQQAVPLAGHADCHCGTVNRYPTVVVHVTMHRTGERQTRLQCVCCCWHFTSAVAHASFMRCTGAANGRAVQALTFCCTWVALSRAAVCIICWAREASGLATYSKPSTQGALSQRAEAGVR